MGNTPAPTATLFDQPQPDVFRYWHEPENIQENCIFCQIANGKIKPGLNRSQELLYQDDLIAAFYDIDPAASEHILIVPRMHVKNCFAGNYTKELHDRMVAAAQKIVSEPRIQQPDGVQLFVGGRSATAAAATSSTASGGSADEQPPQASVTTSDQAALEELRQRVYSKADFRNSDKIRTFFIRPPWNSVYHVHMHVMVLPMKENLPFFRRLGFQNPWFHIATDELEKERRWQLS
ncbi:unnamed protein product [Amoebophrya sp. A120]|nr:unnamed protein product [Amoebophrya sp. A120]|eukprot:GSA120T00007792001.1